MKTKKIKPIVVVSPEEFQKMDSSEIVKIMQKHRHYYIKGEYGVDRCIMKPGYKFWYCDNWTGQKRIFMTLKAAKAAAKKETGVCIHIRNVETGELITVEASGFCPA